MKTTQSEIIAHHQNKEIYWITLENNRGLTVRVTNYGCIIQSIKVPDGEGKLVDVTLGFDDVKDYYSEEYLSNSPYFGAVVGRYANRIANGRFELDGKSYNLTKNDGANQLHGGGRFSQSVWDVEAVDAQNAQVTFRLFSPDGEDGFPGNLTTAVTYSLTDENELIYEIEAITDQPTPVNMTNHAYFNLHGDGSFIGDHVLEIPAKVYLEQEPSLVVTGQKVLVKGTPYDFNAPRRIDEGWDPQTGYDQAFELAKPYGDWGRAAKVYSTKTRISLEVLSSEPVVQLYTGAFLNGIKGKGGVIYNQFSGFCMETHHHPNAVNIPGFPSTILQPSDRYIQKTSFKFGIED